MSHTIVFYIVANKKVYTYMKTFTFNNMNYTCIDKYYIYNVSMTNVHLISV